MSMAQLDITLSTAEIYKITQSLQPTRQLAELHAQGFWRARVGKMGEVVLERAHYEAVCAGALPPITTLPLPETLAPRALLQGSGSHAEHQGRQEVRLTEERVLLPAPVKTFSPARHD